MGVREVNDNGGNNQSYVDLRGHLKLQNNIGFRQAASSIPSIMHYLAATVLNIR